MSILQADSCLMSSLLPSSAAEILPVDIDHSMIAIHHFEIGILDLKNTVPYNSEYVFLHSIQKYVITPLLSV